MKKKFVTIMTILIATITACVLAIFLFIQFVWPALIDNGYIPFTEEYECRVFMEQYEETSEQFNLLLEEVSVLKESVPEEWYHSGHRIFFHCYDSEWNVRVLNAEYETIFEKAAVVQNMDSIRQIESTFGEAFLGIIYAKETDEYKFKIGEYYSILFSENGVEVR